MPKYPETPQVCLHRELAEELDITVKIESFLTEQVFEYEKFTVCLKVFLCSLDKDEITLNDHDEYRWVKKEQLLSFNLAPADVPLVKFYLENY